MNRSPPTTRTSLIWIDAWLMLLGSAIVFFAVVIDVLGFGSPGFGLAQILLMLFGLALALIGFSGLRCPSAIPDAAKRAPDSNVETGIVKSGRSAAKQGVRQPNARTRYIVVGSI